MKLIFFVIYCFNILNSDSFLLYQNEWIFFLNIYTILASHFIPIGVVREKGATDATVSIHLPLSPQHTSFIYFPYKNIFSNNPSMNL